MYDITTVSIITLQMLSLMKCKTLRSLDHSSLEAVSVKYYCLVYSLLSVSSHSFTLIVNRLHVITLTYQMFATWLCHPEVQHLVNYCWQREKIAFLMENV